MRKLERKDCSSLYLLRKLFGAPSSDTIKESKGFRLFQLAVCTISVLSGDIAPCIYILSQTRMHIAG